MRIRKANGEDLDALMALQAACWPPAMRDSEGDIATRLRDDFVLVAEEGTVVAGALFAERREEGWHLYAFEVLPMYQRNGVGSMLVRDTLRQLTAPMTADAVTVAGRVCLERAGFAQVAIRMRHPGPG